MSKNKVQHYLGQAIEQHASDLYLIAGKKPVLRLQGVLQEIAKEEIDSQDLLRLLNEIMRAGDMDAFHKNRDVDFAYGFDGFRFRINLHWQQGQAALSARLIPKEIPTPAQLDFPDIFDQLRRLDSGLVLVTGPSGSGKSTTLAAMIQSMNEKSRRHIITLEDPIEFVYPNKQSIIEQREVGSDTSSFFNGLKYGLRQDPDVILVGEMRDRETMAAALTAAETGHLVLSTLHTRGAADTVARIIDIFEPSRQNQILAQLASSLVAVITQELLPAQNGGRVAVREIMLMNHAISNLIRQNKIEQIHSVLQTGRKEGMQTKEMHLKELYENEIITVEVYQQKISHSTVF